MTSREVLRMERITKVYPNGVVANKDVDLCINEGEIHALSGENGAGKTTLMKILFGDEQPTRGDIYVNGKLVNITSPMSAIKLGIGMVHQHFMLVDSLTAIDNMILGIEPVKGKIMVDRKRAEKMVHDVAEKYNLHIDAHKKVRDLTVGQKQKLEILKALLRGVRILILDEPTAVLTPQETKELFAELKNLKEDGYTIIFISHKLAEVRELCDRITIIRRGESKGVFPISEVSEQEISRLMVGRDVMLHIEKNAATPGKPSLYVKNLRIVNDENTVAVNGISFTAREGEIVGIAGVEGNGQVELVRALTRLGDYHGGNIEMMGNTISRMSISALRKQKVSHIPEDRMTTGIAPSLSITENMIADKIDDPQFSSMGIINKKALKQYGEKMVRDYGIVTRSPDSEITSLSGGNIQKTVLARELSSNPEIIIADQPTRGVDVGATELIRNMLLSMRDAGKTVVLVSSDLNEIIGLSDRLLVMYRGEISAYFPTTENFDEEVLGRFMLGLEKQSSDEIKGAYYE